MDVGRSASTVTPKVQRDEGANVGKARMGDETAGGC